MSAFPTIATIETVKDKLRKYSRFLRRDFLCVLVKTCAKHLQLHTSRDDWRTRAGMLKFFTRAWPRISMLLEDRSAFVGWYAKNFQVAETFLTDRKFAQFIYRNWTKFKDFLSVDSTEEFMQIYQKQLSEVLDGKREHIEEINNEIGSVFIGMIDEFFEERNATKVPKAQNDTIPLKSTVPTAALPLPIQAQEESVEIQTVPQSNQFVETYDFDIDDAFEFNYEFNDDLVNCEDSAMPF